MSRLQRVGVALRAIAKTGSVVVRWPTVLVYPVLLTVSFGLLIPAVAAPIVLAGHGWLWLVWPASVATYFLGGSVLCTVLFGAMFYEVDGVFRGRRQRPFAGLRVAWRKRRTLTALGLTLGSAGLVTWFGKPFLERLLGASAVELLTALQGSGNMYAILIAMVEDRTLPETIEPITQALSETTVESIVTETALQGISEVGLWTSALFGIGSYLLGLRIPPFGVFTPALGFLVLPALTVCLCCLLEGVTRPALYVHATTDRIETARVQPARVLRGHPE